jgi:hypothetical protein
VASLGILVTVIASLGPIIIFFSLCTTSYSFMQLLNVTVCTISGILGLAFLMRTLNRLIISQLPAESTISSPAPQPVMTPGAAGIAMAGPLDRIAPTDRKAKSIFRVWTLVFALVGAQMSWVLRPFIGSPNLPFEWFRVREGNFFMAVFHAFQNLFS